MNYPIKDGQIDPEFLGRVVRRVSESSRYEDRVDIGQAKKVLLAAQEVMQEEEIKEGDKVKHDRRQSWGQGKVGAVTDKTAQVDFGSGRIGWYRKAHLTKI